jgi:hypothetical protein
MEIIGPASQRAYTIATHVTEANLAGNCGHFDPVYMIKALNLVITNHESLITHH